MRTVSTFKNGNNRAIRLPRDLDFDGVSKLEIVREGNCIILRPVRPSCSSFAQIEKADPDFMAEREDIKNKSFKPTSMPTAEAAIGSDTGPSFNWFRIYS